MRTTEEMLLGMNLVEFNVRCRIDFKFFCERMLGLTDDGGIHPFQLEWFYAIQNNKRVVIEAPSGFSKTTIVGVAYPLWLAWNYSNRAILIISKSQGQARRIIRIISDYITDNELLLELKPKNYKATWNADDMATTNKNRIYSRPYSINLKGERVDFALLDEADSYENTDIYFDYVTSRMNPGGKIALISTPEDSPKLFSELKDRASKDYKFLKCESIINLKDPKDVFSGTPIWPERFPISELRSRYEEQGKRLFMKNYFCDIMMEGDDAIFSINAIYGSYSQDHDFNFDINPEAQYFIAADFAISKGAKADFDAYVVIEKTKDFMIIKHIEVHKGWIVPTKVNRLEELYKQFKSNRPTRIIADKSNIGEETIRQLRARGISIVDQDFHWTKRAQLLKNLANVFESGSIVIPRHHEDIEAIKLTTLLTEQLLGFRRKKNENTGNEVILSKAPHDDVAISLALAVSEASKMRPISCVGKSAR